MCKIRKNFIETDKQNVALNRPILEKMRLSVTSRAYLPPTVGLLWRVELEDTYS
jgi:hypothetical protein